MTDNHSAYEETNNVNDSTDRQNVEESDRISIVQWILLFAVLGAVIYFSPVLFSLLPK